MPDRMYTLALALMLLQKSSIAAYVAGITCTFPDDGNLPMKGAHPSIIDPLNPTPKPLDCYDILKLGQQKSGRYDIYPFELGVSSLPVRVWCDMETEGGGWTVIQRREDGTVDFQRGWEDCKAGFGFVGSEFWLGNENIHIITNQGNYELRVELEDWDSVHKYGNWDHFRIGGESTKYKLAISGYSGDAGDSLNYHNNRPFTTIDSDNDANSGNCAELRGGPWWYNSCEYSDLNGEYLKATQSIQQGITWHTYKGLKYSQKHAEMKIRPSAEK